MSTQIIKQILIAGIFLCSLFAAGQNANEEYDRKYTPNESSVFNNQHKGNSVEPTEVEIKNCIKFYPTMGIRQKIFFSYDADLGGGLCLSVGVGKAFGNDFIQSALFFDISDVVSSDVSVNKLISNSNYSGSQPLISIGPKIYFSGKAFEDAYIEFTYRHERMNYLLDSKKFSGGYRVDGANDLAVKMNAFYFGFGYTAVSGKKNNFTHDFFIDFGVKYFKYTGYEEVQVPVGKYNTDNICRQTGTDNKARILPAINMGYAFGFGF